MVSYSSQPLCVLERLYGGFISAVDTILISVIWQTLILLSADYNKFSCVPRLSSPLCQRLNLPPSRRGTLVCYDNLLSVKVWFVTSFKFVVVKSVQNLCGCIRDVWRITLYWYVMLLQGWDGQFQLFLRLQQKHLNTHIRACSTWRTSQSKPRGDTPGIYLSLWLLHSVPSEEFVPLATCNDWNVIKKWIQLSSVSSRSNTFSDKWKLVFIVKF